MKPRVVPRIVIDARMVGPVPHGIARYVTFLAKGLSILANQTSLTYEPVFLVRPGFLHPHLAAYQNIPLESPFLHPKEWIEIPRILKKLNASIYHSPSFSSLWNCPCPSIVTIHDLNHLSYGNWTQKIYYQVLLRRFARKSKAIVTVSEFSRKELSEWLGLSFENIGMVYNSVETSHFDFENSKRILSQLGLESKKYFFCLSNSKPHKNLPLLTSAYEAYKKQQSSPWPLVLTIDRTFSGSSTVRPIGAQNEEVVNALLSHAGGALFPSLYEGFGLPPVEAALFRAPLAVSRIPPHEEGLVDLLPYEVLWTKPTDFHGWVNAFHRLFKGEIPPLSDSSRDKLLRRFSPTQMGLSMDRFYQSVLNK